MLKPRLVLAIAPVIFVLDRATKLLIERKVSFWENITVIPGFFSIVHAQNPGAAFSILADAPEAIRSAVLIGLSLIVTVFVAVMLRNALKPGTDQSPFVPAALSLVLGGALGNIFDRVLKGTVTDFLLFYLGEYQWPAFNVADSAICVGALLLLFDLWRGRGAGKAVDTRVS